MAEPTGVAPVRPANRAPWRSAGETRLDLAGDHGHVGAVALSLDRLGCDVGSRIPPLAPRACLPSSADLALALRYSYEPRLPADPPSLDCCDTLCPLLLLAVPRSLAQPPLHPRPPSRSVQPPR